MQWLMLVCDFFFFNYLVPVLLIVEEQMINHYETSMPIVVWDDITLEL